MQARPIVRIRRANQRDAAEIELLIREAFLEHEPAFTPEAFITAMPGKPEIEKRIEDWAVWIAVTANAIVGTVSAQARGRRLQIRTMAVHPSMRGHGIGKLLLARVEHFAYAHGYKRLSLNTTPFMNRAIRLYEAFGFRFSGSKWNWLGTWCRPMTKKLAAHTKDYVLPDSPTRGEGHGCRAYSPKTKPSLRL